MCGQYPSKPAISRFVAPWDTSGWYSGEEKLRIGTRMYTNADTQVTALPDAYVGADYIRMFDSAAQGFDDKQGVSFHTQTDVAVGLAMDPNGDLPKWVSDFSLSSGSLTSALGTWPIYEKVFAAGEDVEIAGLCGSGHHYFPMIRPLSPDALRALPPIAWQKGRMAAQQKRTYASGIKEIFASRDALARYDTEKCAWVGAPHRGIEIGGNLACAVNGISAQWTCSASVFLEENARGVLALEDGQHIFEIPLDAKRMGSGENHAVRSVCTGKQTEVWFDNRLAYTEVMPQPFAPKRIVFRAEQGQMLLEHFSLCDETEIYAVWEDMSDLPEAMDVLGGVVRRVPFPFAQRGSIELDGADEPTAVQMHFPMMRGPFTFETKVRCETEAYGEGPVLLDARGGVLARVAFYQNNLYATDGGVWKRILGEETSWMYAPCGNWYAIEIKAEPERGVYTLFVDGARRATELKMNHAAAQVCGAGFRADRGGKMYVQRIRVYDDLDLTRGVLPDAQIADVFDFGALGDGKTSDTAAIQRAVDAAAQTGGTVYLHDGVFRSGEIALHSDITFWVDRTAVLLGSQNHADYPLHEPGTSLCAARQLGRGLLYGENLHNVRITGGGMLDGNGLYRFKENDPIHDREALARPSIIYLAYSRDIVVENISLRRSCFWSIVPLSCRNVLMRHLALDCMYTPNRDGIDPVDVQDMTIYDCAIQAGDDGLCFKSSDAMGCERIDVADLTIQSLASGIKIGTDTYFGFQQIAVRDCTLKNVNRCGISIEAVDGAHVAHLRFERIDMTDVGAPAYIVAGNRNRMPRGAAQERTSQIEDIAFDGLRFEKAYAHSASPWIHEVMVIGQSDAQRIKHVRFANCDFALPGGYEGQPGCPEVIGKRYPEYDRHGKSAGCAFTARFAEHFELDHVGVKLEKPDVRPQLAVFDGIE